MERTMILVISTMMVFLTLGFQPVMSQVDVTKTGCGATKFCLAQPTDCNPADNTTTCLFGSALPTAINAPNGVNITFQLKGNTSGFIAVGLGNKDTKDILFFVCGKNSSNNDSLFFTALTFNQTDNSTENKPVTPTDLKYSVSGEIKCEFKVGNLNSTTSLQRSSIPGVEFEMIIASGEMNGGQLGGFNILSRGQPDLAQLLANGTNTTATPTPTTTPSGASHPVYSNAVLLLLSFLTLSLLKFA